jgi:cytochrome P450 family 4
MITPTFHFSILDSFVEVFSEKSEILISKLQKEVGSQGFDVYPYITKCALDIICGKLVYLLFTGICCLHSATEMC